MPRSLKQKEATKRLFEKFVEIDRDDLTDPEIASQVGVSVSTIERFRRMSGRKKKVAYKGFPSKLFSDPEVRKWFEAYHLILNDNEISRHLGICVGTVESWRKKYLRIKKGHIGKWDRTSHPKGFQGHVHSEAAKKRLSTHSKMLWSLPNSPLRTEEESQRRSDASARYQASLRGPFKGLSRYSRAKQGIRNDLGGMYFRSSWEANFARYLNFLKEHGSIFKWEYEADVFWFERIKRGCRFYTPDFKIWENKASIPYYVELKGWMNQKSKTKLDRMKRYYPDIRVDLVGPREYRDISRYAKLIEGWEPGSHDYKEKGVLCEQ